MSTPNPPEFNLLAEAARQALQRGDRQTARHLAGQAVVADPRSEAAWLILAALSAPEESLNYVRKALEINPESQSAIQAMEWALERRRKQTASQPAAIQPPETTPPPALRIIDQPPPASEHPEIPPASLVDSPAPVASISRPKRGRKKWLFAVILLLVSSLVLLTVVAITMLWPRFFPAKGCSANLAVTDQAFPLKEFNLAEDGTLRLPEGDSHQAYWLAGTSVNPVILLLPSLENLTLAGTLQGGETAQLTWPDCTSTGYVLAKPQLTIYDLPSLLDQSGFRITLLLPDQNGTLGYLLQGVLFDGGTTSNDASTAGYSRIGISILESIPSTDGTLISIRLVIANLDGQPINLTSHQVRLTPQGGSPLAALGGVPPLPLVITPGQTQEFTFLFPRLPAPAATLRLLGMDFDVEGY